MEVVNSSHPDPRRIHPTEGRREPAETLLEDSLPSAYSSLFRVPAFP